MDGIELMASAMHAAMAHLDAAASNLANVSTDGFRRQVLRSRLTPSGILSTRTSSGEEAPLKRTGRAFDLAVAGGGAFFAEAPNGRLLPERSASFQTDAKGRLVDEKGRFLMGERGPIAVSADALIDERGFVREAGNVVGRLRLRQGTAVESGFLAGANVDAVHEMVDVLSAQRAFETAQKTLSAIDEARSKAASEVARVKA